MIERFRIYVLVDHRARWCNDLLCALASLVLYTIFVRAGLPAERAFKLSTVFLVFGVFTTTLWYCYTPERKTTAAVVLPRRMLFVQLAKALAAALVVGVIAKFTNTPSVMADVGNASLRRVAHGEPTEAKIKTAARIVREAKANNYPLSPDLVTEVGQKIVNTAAVPSLQKPAIETAAEFATYQSSRQALPLNVKLIDTLTATPTSPKGPTIRLSYGCAEGKGGFGEARLLGIFGFAGFTLSNCADLVVWPAQPEMLPLDNVDGKDASFVNCTLAYNGGKLKLENVRFINCTFQIPAVHAGNKNVFEFLRAAVTGEPISLELK